MIKMLSTVSSYLYGLSFLLAISCSKANIFIFRDGSNKSVEIMEDLSAAFGPSLPEEGFKGYVVQGYPFDGCEPLQKPPNVVDKGPFIALVRRYNCTFITKILNAQKAGFQAVIVRNVASDYINMHADEDGDKVLIPSVFIGEEDGIILKDNFQYDKGFYVVLTSDRPFDLRGYLLPFAITIGICFLIMLIFMLVKCIKDYKKSRRHRLSSRSLKKLPIHKFKKGDPYDCCAVCLEDYADNDKLRILPCAHAYHSKCIDPWLTKNRKVCPVCKRRVKLDNEPISDPESDGEDETAPLIVNSPNENTRTTTSGGTFVQQTENPFTAAERGGYNYRRITLESDSSDEEEPPRKDSLVYRLRVEEDQHQQSESDTDEENTEELSSAGCPSHVETAVRQPGDAPTKEDTKDCIV